MLIRPLPSRSLRPAKEPPYHVGRSYGLLFTSAANAVGEHPYLRLCKLPVDVPGFQIEHFGQIGIQVSPIRFFALTKIKRPRQG